MEKSRIFSKNVVKLWGKTFFQFFNEPLRMTTQMPKEPETGFSGTNVPASVPKREAERILSEVNSAAGNVVTLSK